MKAITTSIFILFILLFTACGNDAPAEESPQNTPETVVPKTDSVQLPAENLPQTAEVSAPAKSTSSPTQKINVSVNKNYLLGKFQYESHPDFVKVEKAHTNRYGEAYLRKEAYDAFKNMYDAAKKEGITLIIISATRDFDRQKEIWNGKWTGKYANVAGAEKRAIEILTYSSMPSTSRHHWGSDMDLNSLNNPYFEEGEGKKIYDWLVAHGNEYGFCQPYTPKGSQRPNGYNEEKWHWSYMPLSKPFLNQYLSTITLDDISGFEGSEVKTALNVIAHYVGGVNGGCK